MPTSSTICHPARASLEASAEREREMIIWYRGSEAGFGRRCHVCCPTLDLQYSWNHNVQYGIRASAEYEIPHRKGFSQLSFNSPPSCRDPTQILHIICKAAALLPSQQHPSWCRSLGMETQDQVLSSDSAGTFGPKSVTTTPIMKLPGRKLLVVTTTHITSEFQLLALRRQSCNSMQVSWTIPLNGMLFLRPILPDFNETTRRRRRTSSARISRHLCRHRRWQKGSTNHARRSRARYDHLLFNGHTRMAETRRYIVRVLP